MHELISRHLASEGRRLQAITSAKVLAKADTGSRNRLLVQVDFEAQDPLPVFVGERELREAEERGYRRRLAEEAVARSQTPRIPLPPRAPDWLGLTAGECRWFKP